MRDFPYSREWCSETDSNILQHIRAPCRLLSRFSPTNHIDSHFREESLEKWLGFLSTTSTIGRRPAPGIAARISRLDSDCGGVLKWQQWQITSTTNWVLNLPRLPVERWYLGTFSVTVQGFKFRPETRTSSVLPPKTLSESISNVNLSFCINATFSSGFCQWYGLHAAAYDRAKLILKTSLKCTPSIACQKRVFWTRCVVQNEKEY